MMNYLHNFNSISVLVRLSMAILFGGIIGLERGRKKRGAGFRTYMLVCLGATLTMILGQYLQELISNTLKNTTLSIDVSRFGAQVINGVGFLGAGTVIVTGKQQVKGLTTAAGLWASACMGLAIGAGFYMCVVTAFFLILIVVRVLPSIEAFIVDHSRNMNFYLEFEAWDDIGHIINEIKANNAQIYEVELSRESENGMPSAMFVVRMPKRQPRAKLLLSLAEVECIHLIEEI